MRAAALLVLVACGSPAPAGLVPTEGTVDGLAFRLLLPPGMTREAGERHVDFSSAGLVITVSAESLPESLEEARWRSVLFPDHSVVTREATLPDGFAVEYHDQAGKGDGGEAHRWVEHGSRALYCFADAQDRGQARLPELSRICASLAAR